MDQSKLGEAAFSEHSEREDGPWSATRRLWLGAFGFARRHWSKLVYPWSIWRLCALPGALVRSKLGVDTWRVRACAGAARAFAYLCVGLPLTLVITAEILISLNQAFISEQENYRLQSDFETSGAENAVLQVPGPSFPRPEAVPPGQTEEYRRYLVELFAPVVIQKMGPHPEWDIPLSLRYDGDGNPRDNVENEPGRRPHPAVVYGELTAETLDSYYLVYSLYHVKDYDHPIREAMSHWTYHDNDNEGFMIRVDKRTLRVEEAEMWFHNRFLLCNNTGVSKGTEPIHGKLQFEDETHLVVYAQSQGHGVRCAQAVDASALGERVKVLRYRGKRPERRPMPDGSVEYDATYDLENFDTWYAEALGPYGKDGVGTSLFEETIPLGVDEDGSELYIGRFIAGYDYAKGSWSRPKPMWSWDDGWDDIPIFVWHFFPDEAFRSHGGNNLSSTYLYNRPCEHTFKRKAEELRPLVRTENERRTGDKWEELEKNHERGFKADSRGYLWMQVKTYVNYLFHALG